MQTLNLGTQAVGGAAVYPEPIEKAITAATHQTVPHTFGAYPDVEVFDENGHRVPRTRYNITCSSDSVRVQFRVAQSGVIRISKP